MDLAPAESVASGAISMPDADDPALASTVRALRADGEIVINCLSGKPDLRCDRELIEDGGRWYVRPLGAADAE